MYPDHELIKDSIIIYNLKRLPVVSVDISKYGISVPEKGFFVGFEALSPSWYSKNPIKQRQRTVLRVPGIKGHFVLSQRPVRMGPASTAEIQKALETAEAYPDSLKAYKSYIYAMGLNNPLLGAQYKVWTAKYPKKVTIPLAFGTVYYNAEMAQAKEYLLKAAAIEPQNADIWFRLSEDAARWGQDDLSIDYIKKATLADPTNIDYACAYLMSFRNAKDATNIKDKIKYLEELRNLYPPQKSSWSSSGMTLLADAYLQTDPQKALIFIDEMEQDQDYKQAIVKIDQIKLPSVNQISEFILLKKASLQEKAGETEAGYRSLALAFAKNPTDQLDTALELFGEKTGKDKVLVMNDIHRLRASTAVPAYPFELGLYTNNDKLNLNDLKGKAVINKFKNNNIVYIGINVDPIQDPYVIPFMNNTKYSFIPLRGSSAFASKYYGVQGEPENFLIDKEGQIIFRDFRIDGENHRTLELMISSLLQ
eukprot:gene8386-8473_t